jgi:hypothetical protein
MYYFYFLLVCHECEVRSRFRFFTNKRLHPYSLCLGSYRKANYVQNTLCWKGLHSVLHISALAEWSYADISASLLQRRQN